MFLDPYSNCNNVGGARNRDRDRCNDNGNHNGGNSDVINTLFRLTPGQRVNVVFGSSVLNNVRFVSIQGNSAYFSNGTLTSVKISDIRAIQLLT